MSPASTVDVSGAPAARMKLLLDRPASEPTLNIGHIASGFASLIETSKPGFAIGISGEWGSGKTTLMQAIRKRLSSDVAVAVAFNAWRFERERELLIPLLDSVRQELADWARERPKSPGVERVAGAARRIGCVIRALLSGMSLEIGLPGAATVTYVPGAALDVLKAGQADGEGPQSVYFAGFQELSAALSEALEGGITRIVVFIDDLDRCLPTTALQVLEAVKLFFDLPGFVFVVGLDEEIVESAVQTRMWTLFLAQVMDAAAAPDSGGELDLRPAIEHGRKHFDKLFQVQFDVPAILAEDLDDLLEAMIREAQVDGDQGRDLALRVRPYLPYLARDGRINPRQVKRFVNAYTLTRLLRLQHDPDVVLAANIVQFRSDWDAAVGLIVTRPALFAHAVRTYRGGDETALRAVWPRDRVVPRSFTEFALTAEAEPLTRADDLYGYGTSMAWTQWRPPASHPLGLDDELDALRLLVQDMETLHAAGPELTRIASEFRGRLDHLPDLLLSFFPSGVVVEFRREVIERHTRALADFLRKTDEVGSHGVSALADNCRDAIVEVDYALERLRRRYANELR